MEETSIHEALVPGGAVPREKLPNMPPLSTSSATTSIATARGCGSVVLEGELLKLGGKKKDKWQQVEVHLATDTGLSWSFGSRVRDTAAGSQKSLTPKQIVRAAYYSEFGVDYAFEITSTAKGGKVYKFAAASDVDRDLWIEAIEHVVGSAVATEPQPHPQAAPSMQMVQVTAPAGVAASQLIQVEVSGASVVSVAGHAILEPQLAAPGSKGTTEDAIRVDNKQVQEIASPVAQSTVRYRAIAKGVIREEADKTSKKVGELEPGTEIIALSVETLDNTVRVQFDRGWVSLTAAGGKELLEEITEDDNDESAFKSLLKGIGILCLIAVAVSPPASCGIEGICLGPLAKLVAILLLVCGGGLATMSVVGTAFVRCIDWCCGNAPANARRHDGSKECIGEQ